LINIFERIAQRQEGKGKEGGGYDQDLLFFPLGGDFFLKPKIPPGASEEKADAVIPGREERFPLEPERGLATGGGRGTMSSRLSGTGGPPMDSR
jgi:hypothetical protein